MSDRAERREEIKLKREYFKLGTLIVAFGTLIVAGFQWEGSSRLAIYAGYERMTIEWRDHLRTFVDDPGLRPYFEEGVELTADDPNREAVLALADVRLDVMDAMLMYPTLLGRSDQMFIQDWRNWRNTFASAFRTSPALCARFHETEASYVFIVPLGQRECVSLFPGTVPRVTPERP